MSKTTILNNQFQVEFDNPNNFLGQGAMGAVYLGKETRTDDPVAIKVLKRDLVDLDPELIQRFQLEGETLRQLNHPNIVKMLGAENLPKSHYLIMEYVGGGSLRDILDKEHKLSVQRALYIALDLADALTRAHRLNVLHRDIKPGNVLIAEDGTPRLTDFGMARVNGTPQITQDGAIVGTMAYLPPEAFQGDEVDHRGDIWAFGIMLWEMLVGERPFPEDKPAPLIQAIVTHPLPDLERIRPDLPTALVDLIYRMLDKNPTSRIPSARLIGAELEAIIRGDDSGTIQAIVSVSDSTGRFDLETTEFPVAGDSKRFIAPNNLQSQPTPFVGRESEIEQLLDMLHDGASLITLTGPGGIGKSRISIEVAKQSLSRFEDGVFVVPLHALDDARNVVTEIGENLEFSFGGGDTKTELSNYLREKHMLLVLDNFETVMDAADVVSELISNAPNLSIIVTSRERLRLRGEQTFDVDSMRLPTPQDEALETLSEFAVIKLFVQSAKRTLPSFELTEDNTNCVAETVRLVGGLPLGVELAAGWLESLPIDEIVDEIRSSLDFLETDLRDVPERHRSLRAVADYSWNLLNEDERDIFVKLSIFRNGFEREAAQKIAGASLRNLTNLVNKSLISREPTGRYYVHVLLRQYGEERFKEYDDAAMETVIAYADYYITLAEKLYVVMQSSKEAAAFKTMDVEFDNIRNLWRLGQTHNKFEKVARLQDALFYYFLSRSMFIEGAELFGGLAKAMEDANQRDQIYWKTRAQYAMFIGRQGQYNEAITIGKDALEHIKTDEVKATVYLLIGNLEMFIGDYDATEATLNAGIDIATDKASWYYPAFHSSMGYLKFLLGDLRAARAIYEDLSKTADSQDYSRTTLANIKNNFGEVLQRLGEYRRALKLYEESLELSKDPYNPRQIAVAKLNIAGIHFLQADYQKATALFEEGHQLYRDIGDRWGIAQALSNLGNVAMAADDHEKAYSKYNAALTIRREMGEKRGIADSLSDLSYCAMVMGNTDVSTQFIKEALEIRREIGDRLGEGEALGRMAMGMLFAEKIDEARELMLQAREIGEETGSSFIYAQATAGLGEAAFMDGDHAQASDYFKLVLRENDADEAPLTMILWALLGMARIKIEHGDHSSALQMVTLILRYPRNFINIIEKRATELLDILTGTMSPEDVEETMTATKSLILRNYIADLLAEESAV